MPQCRTHDQHHRSTKDCYTYHDHEIHILRLVSFLFACYVLPPHVHVQWEQKVLSRFCAATFDQPAAEKY
jgi:hypothetical protein